MRAHHPRIMRALTIGCAVSAVTAGLAACSSGTSRTSSTGPATTVAALTSASSDAGPDADADADAYFQGPLDLLLFGKASQTTPEQDAESSAQDRQVQDLIASCMQAQGFDYVAAVTDYSSSAGNDPYSLPQKEFAEQYGYGVSTIEYTPTSTDPNAAITAAMDLTQLRAYYKALYGDMITVDDDGNIQKPGASARPATDTADPTAQPNADACAIKASTAVYGSKTDTEPADDPFTALEQSMSDLSQAVETDARVADATNIWISCMADAGHPGYTEKTDAPVDVGTRAEALRGGADDFSAVDPAKLQELRQYEIGVAVADYTCGLAWDAIHQTVQTELENTFIDQNRSELEQYRDAIAAGTGGKG